VEEGAGSGAGTPTPVLRYIARRLLLAIPSLWAVFTLVFILVRVVPGDPAIAVLGDYASREAIRDLRVRMGLDRPLWLQYVTFLAGLSKADLGRSLVTGRPIIGDVAVVLPYTIELTFAGILLGVVLGLPLGVLAATRRNSIVDHVARVVSLAGLSVPAFYLAILLLLVFAVRLGWFPVISPVSVTGLSVRLYNLVLPALSLGLIMTAYVMRMTRSTMLQVLSQDYVRGARAKGLAEPRVLWRHVLANTLIPLVTLVGLYSSVLLGGSVMTEIVFNRPGLGKLIVGAMFQRDYAVIQSLLVVYATVVVLINLLTDLSYGLVDPRVRYD
jgi:ABC-type dipeptide/oligopeptide/nickel transport system permease component